MKALKKISAFILVITMILPNLTVMAEKTEEVGYIVSISETFDEKISPNVTTPRAAGIEVIDDEHGKAAYIQSVSAGNVDVDLPDKIDKNIAHISFDYMQTKIGNLMYLRFYNSKNTSNTERESMLETFIVATDGKMSYVKNSRGYAACENFINIEPNRWYDVNICIDFDLRIVSYSFDDIQIGHTKLPENYTADDIKKLRFSVEKDTGGKVYLDNIKVASGDRESLKELKENGANIPDVVFAKATAEAGFEAIGNIFHGKEEIEFVANIINTTDSESELTLKYVLYDGEEIVGQGEQKEMFAPNEERRISVAAKSSKFGFFEGELAVYDDEGEFVTKTKRLRFSVVNAIEEGLSDPDLGINVNTDQNNYGMGDAGINAELAYKIGFGFLRVEPRWESVELTKGKYIVPNKVKNVVKLAEKYNRKLRPILAFGNSVAYTGENPPKSENEMNGYVNYGAAVVDMLGPYIDGVEVWNEYNLEGGWFNRLSLPPEQYAQMLTRTYDKIKAVNPDIKVYGMDTAGVPLDWIERVLKSGGDKAMDEISVHPYSNRQSPEAGGFVNNTNNLKKLMTKYGIEDKPIYYSEVGYASVGTGGYPDEMEQAAYFIRMNTLNKATDSASSIAWYCMNDGGLVNTQEQRFGMVRSYQYDVPYEAKPLYLSAANYINMMHEAEFVEQIELAANIKVCRFKLKNGKDCAVVWSISGIKDCGINLGVSSVDVVDMYGNARHLNSVDGKFSLQVSTHPVYLVGDFSSFEKCEPLFETNKASIEGVKGDKADFTITSKVNEAACNYILPKGITLDSESGFLNKNGEISENKIVLNFENNKEAEQPVIRVEIFKDDAVVYMSKININYSDAISVDMMVAPYNAKQLSRHQLVFSVKSNTYSNELTGKIRFNSPQIMAELMGDVDIPAVQPGETVKVKVNIPKEIDRDMISVDADVLMSDGSVKKIAQKVSSDVCVYADSKPMIDGVLEAGEWNQDTRLVFSQENRIKINQFTFGDENDLAAVAYTAWDEENFYYALEVTDDIQAFAEDAYVLWGSDGVQTCIVPSKSVVDQLVQLDFGIMDNKKILTVEISPNAANLGDVNTDNYDMEIARVGNVTIYETRIPWKTIFFDGFTPKAGIKIAFSTLVNDHDGEGRKGYIEYGSGVGSGTKNVTLFRDMYLQGAQRR